MWIKSKLMNYRVKGKLVKAGTPFELDDEEAKKLIEDGEFEKISSSDAKELLDAEAEVKRALEGKPKVKPEPKPEPEPEPEPKVRPRSYK